MFFDDQTASRSRRRFALRALLLALVGLGAVAFVVMRISYLTLARGEYLHRLTEDNILHREPIKPPRGAIVDRLGRTIAASEPRFHVYLSPYHITSPTLQNTLQTVERYLGDIDAPPLDKIMRLPSRGRQQLATYRPLSDVLPLMERQANLPGLQIEQDFERFYPRGRDTSMITGFVGAIRPSQMQTYLEEGYAQTDMVGQSGIERKYEAFLSGEKGWQIVRRDALQRVLQRLYVDDESKAVRGAKMTLTLDMDLQTTVTSILAPYSGSIVVMDPRNGDVLAIASHPNYDANHPEDVVRDGNSSYFKAIRSHSAPGSTFKLVTATAYLLSGGSPDRRIHCGGVLEISPDFKMYCDARNGHGSLDLRQALRYSCNIYFYQVAMEMSLDHMLNVGRMFGFGQRTGIAVTERGESPGRLGHGPRGGTPVLADKVMMAIGQGQLISTTPIQLAVAYSTLANGGQRFAPRIVQRIESADGRALQYPPVPQGDPIPWTRAQRQAILDGLHDAVNASYGTARHADFPPGVREMVAGKTGTAQRHTAKGMVADAYFVCFAPWKDPEICIVVALEEAGHGGEAAAPLAKYVLLEYLKLKEQRNPSLPQQEAPNRVASRNP